MVSIGFKWLLNRHDLTVVELILVPLVIPVGFRPPNGWEAMNGK
jgi:hypothetical protein